MAEGWHWDKDKEIWVSNGYNNPDPCVCNKTGALYYPEKKWCPFCEGKR